MVLEWCWKGTKSGLNDLVALVPDEPVICLCVAETSLGKEERSGRMLPAGPLLWVQVSQGLGPLRAAAGEGCWDTAGNNLSFGTDLCARRVSFCCCPVLECQPYQAPTAAGDRAP